jgi:hypothetical protein
MIKMMILAPRRQGMSHAEFRRYVTEVHGPLVKSVPEVAADIHHYHYNFPVDGALDAVMAHPLATSLDVITEAWFDSVEAQKANMRLPRYLEIVRPDEHRFADGERAVMHYAREVPLLDGQPTTFKIFYLRRRRPGLSRLEFQERWLAGMQEVLKGVDGQLPGVAKYVQNHVLSEAEHPDGTDEKYLDVIEEFFLSESESLEAFAGEQRYTDGVRRLERDLLDAQRTRAFVAQTVFNIP